jgi:hypothetical protein
MSSTKAIYAGLRVVGLAGEDDRRDLYERVTGKRRLREMNDSERAAVVEELRRLGFKPSSTPGKAPRKPAAPRADLRYIHVLWKMLAGAGAIRKPGRAGLNAFVRARFEGKWQSVPIDIDTLRDAGQINDVIRALKDMCARAGLEAER